MQITDVRIRKVDKEGKMKAIVSITFDNEFVIHDIKVIEGEKGLFIAMPSRKTADGEYRDIAHPIKSSTREAIHEIILDKYQAEMISETAICHDRRRKYTQSEDYYALLCVTHYIFCLSMKSYSNFNFIMMIIKIQFLF